MLLPDAISHYFDELMMKFLKNENIEKVMSIPTLMKSVLVVGAFAVPLMTANALPSDANQPIRLLADRATYVESTGVTTYSGNVTIEQGTLKIAADNITLNLSNDRKITSAVASGKPATFQQIITKEKGLAKGRANRIDYNAVTGIVTLSGGAKLTQAGASFAGNTIRYSLKAGDVEANAGGGQRVELVFPPSGSAGHQSLR